MNRTEPSVSEAIDRYLLRAQAKGLAFKTVRFYRDSLSRIFEPWCRENGVRLMAEVDQDVLDRFTIDLQTRPSRSGAPLSKATQRSYLRAVAAMMTWGREQGLVGDDRPTLPRLQKKHRDVLSRREIEVLELSADNERDRLIIRLMGDLGAREGEIANLRVSDIVLRGGSTFLLLRGKTGERECPVARDVADRLIEYRAHTRPRATSDALFLTRQRRPHGDYEPIGGTGIYQAVREAAHRANLGRPVYPHLLRHSALTHLVAAGIHPAMITAMTGVSTNVIAQHYSHPSPSQLAAAANQAWTD